MSVVVAALYQFVSLPDYREIQPRLKALCHTHGIMGTLLLAQEGINGTVAGTRAAIDALNAFLADDGRFGGLEYKESHADTMPFYRMKVRLKKEIVTLGVPTVDPTRMVGRYLEPAEWNALLQDPDVILVDTRNDYEYEVGTFKGALNPNTKTFREFPDYVAENLDPKVHKKVAMFCTGGIRCEKSTAFMLEQGFDEVYHLKGGILKYLETVKPEESLWEGACFVFDHRVSITHGLGIGEHDLCHGCRAPITAADKESPLYERGVTCPKCINTLTDAQKNRARERQGQIDLARQRGQSHLGPRNEVTN